MSTTSRRRRALAAAALAALTLTACGSADSGSGGGEAAGGGAEFDLSDWSSVEEAAKGSWIAMLNGMLQYYLGIPAPEELSDEEWALKVKVLERITTEANGSHALESRRVSDEIEALRDR